MLNLGIGTGKREGILRGCAPSIILTCMHPCRSVRRGKFNWIPFWLLPHPLDVINICSSTLGVGQTCIFAMLIIHVECFTHDCSYPRKWIFNYLTMVEYEHGVCVATMIVYVGLHFSCQQLGEVSTHECWWWKIEPHVLRTGLPCVIDAP